MALWQKETTAAQTVPREQELKLPLRKLMSCRVALSAAGVGLAVALVFWLAPGGTVAAHANLLRSSPAANASLADPPTRVIIWFTEPVEPQFSEIRVLSAGGARVDNGDTAGDPTEPSAISVSIQPLDDGVYTVAWRNVSRVDGHAVRGSFVFSIGQAAAPVPAVTDAAPLLQSPADPWQRWLFFVGAVALTGGLLFELFVVMPVLGAADPVSPQGTAAQKLSDRLTVLLAVSLALVFAGSAGHLVQQAALTSGRSVVGAIGSPAASVVFDTGWGRLWLVRTVFFALAGACIFAAARARRPEEGGDSPGLIGDSFFALLALAFGVGGLAVTTLMSHSAALPADVRSVAIVSDFIHIAAAAAWVGGLIYLTLTAAPVLLGDLQGRDRREVLGAIVPRFTTVAFLGVGALTVTGLFSGWMHVTVPAAVRTPYGWALAAKASLIVPLLILAFINSYIVRPRLGGDDRASGWLRRFVTLEAVLAVTVLLAVGWLASLEPARQNASRTGIAEREDARFETTVEGARMTITVSPARLGYNLVAVQLKDRRGDPITNATDVRARLVYLEEDLGSEFIAGLDHGGGIWIVHGAPLTVSGEWRVEVVVVRPDAFDARVAFPFRVQSTAVLADRIRPTAGATRWLFGMEVALLGLVAVAAAAPLRRTARRAALALAGPGAAAVIAGTVLAIAGMAVQTGGPEAQVNPVLPTQQSVEAGRVIYAARCASCHGVGGRGDGPAGEFLARRPSDLIVHVPLHPDRRLFEFIRDGVPGRGMPGAGGETSERQIWDLVNYLRALSENR
jgi:copper transport protein